MIGAASGFMGSISTPQFSHYSRRSAHLRAASKRDLPRAESLGHAPPHGGMPKLGSMSLSSSAYSEAADIRRIPPARGRKRLRERGAAADQSCGGGWLRFRGLAQVRQRAIKFRDFCPHITSKSRVCNSGFRKCQCSADLPSWGLPSLVTKSAQNVFAATSAQEGWQGSHLLVAGGDRCAHPMDRVKERCAISGS